MHYMSNEYEIQKPYMPDLYSVYTYVSINCDIYSCSEVYNIRMLSWFSLYTSHTTLSFGNLMTQVKSQEPQLYELRHLNIIKARINKFTTVIYKSYTIEYVLWLLCAGYKYACQSRD